ncbi:MAG TPA: TraM recognition domain-containing protein [Acetobacteraceae bacterium]|nr:TraM recognition domain-containing protein [Acetobacteraceae bacterium]
MPSLVKRLASGVSRIIQDHDDIRQSMEAFDRMYGGNTDPNGLSPNAVNGALGKVAGADAEKIVSFYGAVQSDGGWVLPEDKRTPDVIKKLRPFWVKVPGDLAGIHGGMPRLTADGKPVESVSLAEEWGPGTDPITVPLIYTLIPMIAAAWVAIVTLTNALAGILPAAVLSWGTIGVTTVLSLALVTLFLTIEEMTNSVWTGLKALLIGAALPIMLNGALPAWLSGVLAAPLRWFHEIPMELIAVGAVIVLLGGLIFSGVVAFKSGGLKHTLRERLLALFWFGLYIVALVYTDVALPSVAKGIFVFVPGCLMAVRNLDAWWRYRAQMLLLQFSMSQSNMQIRSFQQGGMIQSTRNEQILSASRDTSHVIKLGTCTGSSALKAATPFTPSAGADMSVSAKDLGGHTIVFGISGTGKTASLARPVAYEYWRAGEGGLLIMDGKGQLPKDLRPIIDIMIEPGADWAIMAGLDAVQVSGIMRTFKATGKAVKDSDENGKDSHWREGAQSFTTNCTYILGALHRHEIATRAYEREQIAKRHLEMLILEIEGMDGADVDDDLASREDEVAKRQAVVAQDREWRWTYGHLYDTVRQANAGLKSGTSFTVSKEVLHWRDFLGVNASDHRRETNPETIYPDVLIERSGLLMALEAVEDWVVNQPEETRNSFFSNIMQAFTPLMRTGTVMHNADGIPWIALEQGTLRTDGVFYGKNLGVALNVEKLGDPARIITQIVRGIVHNEIKRRDDDWANDPVKPGQKPVMIVIDECHLIVGSEEANLITTIRSKGGSYFLLTQGLENFQGLAGFEEKEVLALISQCSNLVTFQTSEFTYAYIEARCGKTLAAKTKMWTNGNLSFDNAWAQFKGSPLFDASNPFAAFYQKLRNHGYGHVTIRPTTKDGKLSVHKGGHHLVDQDMLAMYMESLKHKHASAEIEEVEVDRVSKADLQAQLMTKGRGDAFVYLTRAGAPRYDFCKLQHMTPAQLRARIAEHKSQNETAQEAA